MAEQPEGVELALPLEKFDMSSEEFMQRMRSGTAPDTVDTMHWMILLDTR